MFQRLIFYRKGNIQKHALLVAKLANYQTVCLEPSCFVGLVNLGNSFAIVYYCFSHGGK